MTNRVNKTLNFRATPFSLRDRTVLLATINKDHFLNIYTDHYNGRDCLPLSADQARKLRDALLEIYPVEPKVEEHGTFIISMKEAGQYKPSARPAVHHHRSFAEAEARRLAQVHGGTFHVFRAVHEASREKPVIPPVKTRSL